MNESITRHIVKLNMKELCTFPLDPQKLPACCISPFRNAIQLEEALKSLSGTAIASEKQAAALASGEVEYPESILAELRARHQVCHMI